MEYIALRNIKQGEEIVMDYGPTWEKAWYNHIQTWKPIKNNKNAQNYQLAQHVMKQDEIKYGIGYFRTIYEQMQISNNNNNKNQQEHEQPEQQSSSSSSYPFNVVTMCLPSYTRLPTNHWAKTDPKHIHPQRPVYTWLQPPFDQSTTTTTSKKRRSNNNMTRRNHSNNKKKNSKKTTTTKKDLSHWLLCIVTERHEEETIQPRRDNHHHNNDTTTTTPILYSYTVDVKLNNNPTNPTTNPNPTNQQQKQEWIRILNVPPQGIGLYDLAYTQDIHLPNVFQQNIGIPNDIMPMAWINRL